MSNVTQIMPLEPLLEPIKNLVGTLEFLVGGIFGLYLIFAIVQYYYARRKDKLLNEILGELKDIGKTLKSNLKRK
ncbi:hypothetical protein HYU10_04735 [Candidatus Woesearchaeota archaeon]|nr:hypothetical protein [Candidatus Woesearchaeota archaeon]MBI2131046.1 hypothetical protein [Candidatus Woesearchaeota archaeon]